MHWLAHVLGLDSASGPAYLAWSGFGRYHAAGGAYVVCARHSPGGKPTHARIIAAHRRHLARRAAPPGEGGERLYDPSKDRTS